MALAARLPKLWMAASSQERRAAQVGGSVVGDGGVFGGLHAADCGAGGNERQCQDDPCTREP